MTMADHVKMFCFCCKKELEELSSGVEGHPVGALCFTGSAPYGSRFDSDHQEVGLSGYEIYVCDDCWEERRTFALGYKVPHRPKPKTDYVSGQEVVDQLNALYDSWKERKND